MRYTLASVSIGLLGALAALGTIHAADAAKEPVIRISASLVQIDVVVTDRAGHQVTNLTPSDFEVREDGRTQKVTHLTYVGLMGRERGGPDGPSSGVTSADAPHPPPRTIAIVVDDLGLSFASAFRVRQALGKLVDGLAPDDKVAIVTTGAGADGLDFTTERVRTHEAVAALKYRVWNRTTDTTVASLRPAFPYGTQLPGSGGPAVPYGGPFPGRSDRDLVSWDERLALQSLGVVQDIIEKLGDVPGRKALVVVSEGFSVFDRADHGMRMPVDPIYGDSANVMSTLRKLGDLAARSAVVVHALDPRGLVVAGFSAEDSQLPDLQAQRLSLDQSQASLRLLPDETGGITVTDNNDLASGFESIVADLAGYYLIGYEPGGSTFAGPKGQPSFHKISVKAKPRGLTARTRKGFYGVTDEAIAAAR